MARRIVAAPAQSRLARPVPACFVCQAFIESALAAVMPRPGDTRSRSERAPIAGSLSRVVAESDIRRRTR